MDNKSSELVKAYIRGDNNAIVMLFMDEYEKLKVFSYNIIKDIDTTDDVLQDVLNGKVLRWPVYALSNNIYRVISGLGGLGFFY